MKQFPLRQSLMSAVFFCILGTGTAAQSIYDGPIDVIFKVRIKVEGHVPAVDKGISVFCDLWGSGVNKSLGRRLLAAGEVFSPQTADGYIEAEIKIRDVEVDMSIFENDPTITKAMNWRCDATQRIEEFTAQSFIKHLAADQYVANKPALPGTCTRMRGALDLAGNSYDVSENCATQ